MQCDIDYLLPLFGESLGVTFEFIFVEEQDNFAISLFFQERASPNTFRSGNYEPPSICPDDHTVLEEGMVISTEPEGSVNLSRSARSYSRN